MEASGDVRLEVQAQIGGVEVPGRRVGGLGVRERGGEGVRGGERGREGERECMNTKKLCLVPSCWCSCQITQTHLPLSLPFSCLYVSVVLFLFVQGFDFFSNLLICQHLFFHLWNPVSDLSP